MVALQVPGLGPPRAPPSRRPAGSRGGRAAPGDEGGGEEGLLAPRRRRPLLFGRRRVPAPPPPPTRRPAPRRSRRGLPWRDGAALPLRVAKPRPAGPATHLAGLGQVSERLGELVLPGELRLLGGAAEGQRRALAARDGLRDEVEVAGADLSLVARGRVPRVLELELALLKTNVGGHALGRISPRQLEHRLVERVEAGERDELEPIAHLAQLLLEGCDVAAVQMTLPVEGGRAVIGEELPREALVDRGGELARLAEVRGRRLAPNEVGVGRVREAPGDGGLEPARNAEEALGRPLARDEGAVALVDIAGEERRAVRVRARDQERGDAADVCREPGRRQRPDELTGRDEHLAAEVAALLLRGELILEVHGRDPCFDHRLHELEGVEGAAEAGLRVGDDGSEPAAASVSAFGPLDLVGSEQRLVQPADER